MDYFTKVETKPKDDLTWNIPERKQGTLNIIGGNAAAFKTEIKVAEFLSTNYPIENVNLVLPDALKSQLPPLPNFIFAPSTDAGSFAESQTLIDAFKKADFNIILGDLSKNSITKKAISSACKSSDSKNAGDGKPLLITRDGIEAITDSAVERILMNESLILMATMPQLQKLLRAVYYPKMLLLSQSLIQAAETLHKFTLSYPIKIITNLINKATKPISFIVIRPLRLPSSSTIGSFSFLALERISFAPSRVMPSFAVTRPSEVIFSFIFFE